jgi:hypothetical protein
MIHRKRMPIAMLLGLGALSAPAFAGTLYRCAGGAEQPVSYSSSRVPGMTCKAISYSGGGGHRRSPAAFGYGPGSGGAGQGTPAQPPSAVPHAGLSDAGLAASVTIPAAQGAPAIAKVGAAPKRGGMGGSGGSPHVVFRTSDASEALVQPPVPTGVHARVTRGAMYKYDRDGVTTYTNVRPPGSVGARVLFTYIETCYACGALPGVNFGTMALNTRAYASEIAAAAQAYGVDEALVRAIIHAESDYNPNAVSYKGARGLMQLMPGTANRFGVQNPFVAAENISGGVQYLSFLSRRYNGDIKLIAAAYNSGEGNVDRYGGVPPFAETQRYVERVGMLAERYRAAR